MSTTLLFKLMKILGKGLRIFEQCTYLEPLCKIPWNMIDAMICSMHITDMQLSDV